jgi:drug/metabolite transporter (DMT)-like permease
MLWGALAFALMGALGHLAGERCSWQLVAVARTSVALVFCWAVAVIGLNRLGGVDPRAVVAHFALVSTVVSLAFFLLTGADFGGGSLGDPALAALLVGVGLSGTLGQLGMTRAFALGHPSKVAVVGLTQIVFACLFDLVIWRHRFDALTVCGILLVVAPTAWLLLHSPLRRGAAIHTTS